MTQFNSITPRRAGGELDVYTGLLCAAFLVLLTGVFMLAMTNMEHSKESPNAEGGMFKIISSR